DPSLNTVTSTRVASSSKAFSTSSLTISFGETQVLAANSLKKDGWTRNSVVITYLTGTLLPLSITCKTIIDNLLITPCCNRAHRLLLIKSEVGIPVSTLVLSLARYQIYSMPNYRPSVPSCLR